MRKKDLLMTMILSLSMTGCSEQNMENAAESLQAMEYVENAAEAESETAVDKSAEISKEDSYTECGDLYILDSGGNAGTQVDMDSWDLINKEYVVSQGINVYYTDTSLAGHTKDNATISTASGNGEWYFCVFDKSGYLVKAEDLADIEVVDAKKEEIAPDKQIKDTTPNKPKEPSIDTPVAETSIATESTKYTPEEAIAVYRSIMEANGIKWNPDLKNGGSWGTGFLYLDKGYPEWAGNSSVESFKMGNGDGVPWDNYYLEVTGSDENAVYYTKWGN